MCVRRREGGQFLYLCFVLLLSYQQVHLRFDRRSLLVQIMTNALARGGVGAHAGRWMPKIGSCWGNGKAQRQGKFWDIHSWRWGLLPAYACICIRRLVFQQWWFRGLEERPTRLPFVFQLSSLSSVLQVAVTSWRECLRLPRDINLSPVQAIPFLHRSIILVFSCAGRYLSQFAHSSFLYHNLHPAIAPGESGR
jgi:hypothetical protein